MDLGTFSISLAVKDLEASLSFYQAFGFEIQGGQKDQGWLILRNGEAKIGLFQGMFEDNILTFNPKDVRQVQRHLKEAGIPLIHEADEASEGPAHATLKDPDGNSILLDQH